MYLKCGKGKLFSCVVWDLMPILQWPGSTVLCSSSTFDISRHLMLQFLGYFLGLAHVKWILSSIIQCLQELFHKQCSLEEALECKRPVFPSFSAIICYVRNHVDCSLYSHAQFLLHLISFWFVFFRHPCLSTHEGII